ncbi:hypothetical protein ACFSCW_02045 [Sphingomonas tabacisoli]|uniref:Secreted protein n=1 Tax=Sphingomonas tabacisoli TaxID=2249466 RepID=A0ABW4I0L5_9SPHN
MTGVVVLAFSAAALAAASPKLSFGAINGTDDLSNAASVATCDKDMSGGSSGKMCTLARTEFGGLPIQRSTLALNAAGKARSLTIALDASDYETAAQMLQGRYGLPERAADVARWRGFADDASISIRRTGEQTLIAFAFPANEAANAGPDAQTVWAMLGLTALGLAGGMLLRRGAAARPAHASVPQHVPPALSMRDTLARRLRNGEDLQF